MTAEAATRRTTRPIATTVSPQAFDSRRAVSRRRARSAERDGRPGRPGPPSPRSMPDRSSSAGVASTATRSPTATGWSRPGTARHLPRRRPGTTATGARWPKLAAERPARRLVTATCTSTTANALAAQLDPVGRAAAGTPPRTTGRPGPPGRGRLPVPSTRSRARPTEGLASRTTSRTSGRASRTRMAISRVASSSDSTQMTAWARSRPASASPSPIRALRRMSGDAPALHDLGQPGIRGVVDHHHRHPALVQLLDRAQPHAVEAAHDDVAVVPPTRPSGTGSARWATAPVPRRHRF